MKYTAIDMTGQKYGRLTVLQASHKDKRGEWHWLCQCECGKQKTVSGYKLRSGNTKSCGCMQRECLDGRLRRTHGMSTSHLYTIWENMKHRCNDPKNIVYRNYGGRGIRVCDEWMNSFDSFAKWAESTGYLDGLSIERVDVNGNYEPSNCKWITKRQQYLNRTDSHRITAFGKTQTIKEWSDETGIKYDTIERRINQYGWTPERAVTAKPWERASK